MLWPPETSCDARDNDCDGVADEECPCNYLGIPSGKDSLPNILADEQAQSKEQEVRENGVVSDGIKGEM